MLLAYQSPVALTHVELQRSSGSYLIIKIEVNRQSPPRQLDDHIRLVPFGVANSKGRGIYDHLLC